MPHIQPFTISGYEFRHVSEDDDNASAAGLLWWELKSGATRNWRDGERIIRCGVDEPFEVFVIYDQNGEKWGVWSLYRIREVGPGSISALCSPTFPEIRTMIPQPLTPPGGSDEIIHTEERTEGIASRVRFWRQTFACIESMLKTPMQMIDGTTKTISHFRFPSVADGDPAQHEWSGVRDKFDRYCKVEVEFDSNGTAVKATPTLKSVDPDPERMLGEFDAL